MISSGLDERVKIRFIIIMRPFPCFRAKGRIFTNTWKRWKTNGKVDQYL
jgi:hypothetical protein